MFNKTKKRFKRHKYFYYLLNLVRYFGKIEFQDFVRGFGGPDTLLIRHFGVLYPEQLIYCIENTGGEMGFFAEMQRTLKYLYYADRFNLKPVIYWGNKGLYQENMPVNGTKNVFEYYFQPVSEIGYEEISNCSNVVFSYPRQVLAIMGEEWEIGYQEIEQLNLKFAEVYRKYCKLNITTRKYIESNLWAKLQGRKTLGIHIRGTDFKQQFNLHPMCITPRDFVKPAKQLMKKHGYQQLFLATDSLEAVELFQQEFGDILVYYNDIERSDGDIGLHCLENNREKHHYMLGLEVLRDAYTLAGCDSLLAGMSNVSRAAQYIRISNGKKYDEVMILDHGINHNSKTVKN